MSNKWLLCGLGVVLFWLGSCGGEDDSDVDCDEETGAWAKCEDGKLKQCYKGELSGDFIYKSEKCESGECASETACKENDAGVSPGKEVPVPTECNEKNEGKTICTTDGQHAYYATCIKLVNPDNPSETSYAFDPKTK